jgi:formylglycine-generating enzyme required for sulfatase activity/predicted Ser/Thr protein kinase
MSGSATAEMLTKGQTLAECRVERFLGRGGMGEVYLAWDPALARWVALKVIRPDVVRADHIERFLQEARICAQVDHPNVVTIYRAGRDGELHYILMKYVEGKNLTEWIEDLGGRPQPWQRALKVAHAAARGLGAVHKKGGIHRDIKPSNIMVSKEGRVYLMDFGLARELSQSDRTQSGHLIGTPAFMSPEQCKGLKPDGRSDIFSLGGTLYYLLTARLPFEGPLPAIMAQIMLGKGPLPVHQVNRSVPRAVSELVTRAMAPSPVQRFADADALVRALGQLLHVPEPLPSAAVETQDLSGQHTTTGPPPDLAPLELIPETEGPARLHPAVPWALGGVGVCLAAAFLALLLLSGKGKPGAAVSSGGAPTRQSQALVKDPAGVLPSPVPARDWPGMVWIPDGRVRIGNKPEKLRRYLQSVPGLGDDKQLCEQIIQRAEPEGDRQVFVPGFRIDKYEVTNEAYAQFVRATGCRAPSHWKGGNPPPGRDKHPVVGIGHGEASAFAAWAGKKLPTDHQWLRAYRGDTDRLLPWGDTWEPTRTNVVENSAFPSTSAVVDTPLDVGDFGVCNLVGNVDEMMRDLVERDGTCVVARGAHWNAKGSYWGLACYPTFYEPQAVVNTTTGFRCVVEGP